MTKSVRLFCDAMPRATRYEFRYRKVGTSIWSAIIASTFPFVIVTLDVGASYQYQVRTICGLSITDWATAGANVYTIEGACVTPAGILVEQLPNSYDFRISWVNTGVTGWNFRYRRQGDLTWLSTTLSAPEITLTGLIIGSTYEYQVQSICAGSVISDWGNIGNFAVRNATGSQACPFAYEDEFTGTLIGRKDVRNVVSMSGNITYISPDPLPDAGDFVIIGTVAMCCAPNQDTTIPVSSAGFTGELTITASGQLNLYIGSFTGTPSLNFILSQVSYLGSEGTCPPIEGGGTSNEIIGALTLSCSTGGSPQGYSIISITFPAPTPAPIAIVIGYLENSFAGSRYIGSDIFNPPPGTTPVPPSADAHAPYLLNIPAGVTSFTSSGPIVQKGFGNDGIHTWSCANGRTITDIYIKVDSPSTYVAALTVTNGGITIHNV